ncbi:uncharacterized protein LOC114532829 [Dendronephthya gigantea]|uniref:uncharacterized protein LOC114532829 n=1 Tax=Dendronephthya gigantea TaxID=151771 RepID=UPI0010694E2E|nr:uncharacterized protein LOC114532829 [Dendronephthya gigantea]
MPIFVDLFVCATKMSENRNGIYEATVIKKIVHIINALFNGRLGGTLRIKFDPTYAPKRHIKESVRKIEQKVCEFTGVATLVYDLTIVRKSESMEITVARTDINYIYTLNYHLYLPTNQQVIELSPKDPIKKVRDILCKNIPSLEVVTPGSHFKNFILGSPVGFGESKTVQFKSLLVKRTKSSNLTQRLIKNGKLQCYVSAFANYRGGHIYIGIDDDGIVQGETITLQDRLELETEVSKAIKNMIWPDNSQTDREEKQWQMVFEEVKYKNGGKVASTFVIVIYVAQRLGGVFTQFPESYEMRENEAKMIDFETWTKYMVEGLGRAKDGNNEESDETSKASYELDIDKMLTNLLIDDCEWSDLKEAADKARDHHDSIDIRLICLSKLIKLCLRKGYFEKADEMFKEYKTTLSKSENVKTFEIVGEYLNCLSERSRGNFKASCKIAMKSLQKLDKIHPDIVSAAYLLMATVFNITAMKKEGKTERSPFITRAKECYCKAEIHLQYVSPEFKAAKMDLRHKINMTKAMFFSGSSLEGTMLLDRDVSVINTDEAQNCLDESHHIVIRQKSGLSDLRSIQKLLAQSDLFYQAGTVATALKKEQVISDALKFAKRAEHLAEDAGVPEMRQYARNRVMAIENHLRTLETLESHPCIPSP